MWPTTMRNVLRLWNSPRVRPISSYSGRAHRSFPLVRGPDSRRLPPSSETLEGAGGNGWGVGGRSMSNRYPPKAIPHKGNQRHKRSGSIPVSRGYPWMFRRRPSAASGGSFAGNQVVTFTLGVRLDSGQVRASRGRLPSLHFDFGKRKTRIEFDARISQFSRLRDDGGQLLACCIRGSRVGNVVFAGLDARCSDGGSPADVWILALGGEGPRVLHRVFRCRCFTLREQRAGEYAPSSGFVVADFLCLKDLESLPDCGFLFGGRTRLLQRQIRKRELSFRNRKLFPCRGSESECLFVHLAGSSEVGFIE